MAVETKQPQKASGPKRIRRIQIGFNVLAQIVLILFLTVAINSIVFKHYQRWDVSREQKYALSDITKRFVKGTKGKQAITSAMMDLVEGKKNTLGYVVGHKEPPLSENSAISILKTFIENENIRFQELNLFNLDAIPSELKTILIVGPQYDLSDREMKLLRDFWDKQGRILLLLDPSAKTPRLDGFLKELGVKVNDDRLMVFLRTGIEEVALTRDVQAHFLGGSPITKRLVDVRALFFGGTSSLTLEPDRVRTANIRIDPLIQAEKGYFAETDYNTDDQT